MSASRVALRSVNPDEAEDLSNPTDSSCSAPIPPQIAHTLAEASRISSVSNSALRDAIQRGELPIVVIGGRERLKFVIRRVELERFLETRQRTWQQAREEARGGRSLTITAGSIGTLSDLGT